jgi:hypothetical protein
MPPKPRPLIARFEEYVDRSGGVDACHLWTGYCDRKDYGRFFVNGSTKQFSHRVAWELYIGPIPDGMCVLHDCPTGDNPRCVNTAHLWIGTVLDNNKDCFDKGRHSRGQDRSSLTEKDVADIVAMRGVVQIAELAAKYGVSASSISRIQLGVCWQHVTRIDSKKAKRLVGKTVGEKSPNAKLTDGQVLEILSLLKRGKRQIDIAVEYGVSDTLISNINRGRSWGHLSLEAQ